MQTMAKGPGAGWWWLVRGCAVLGRDTGKILGASALLLLCMVAITAAQMFAPPGHVKLLAVGLTVLAGGVLYPVLYGGFMRVIDASRNGRAVRATTVFEPFRPGGGGSKLALFGVCMLVVYIAFIAIVIATVGRDMGAWYVQVLMHQAALGSPPQALPKLPADFAVTCALVTVFFLFYSGAMAIGVGQASLRREAGVAAFRDGIAGAFKNVLPLVVLAVCGVVALMVASIVVGLVLAVIAGLAMLVGKVAGLAVIVVAYLVLLLFFMPVMMGINYAVWHDVAGGQPPNALADVQG